MRILFVCLGNICRSPAAEGIFNHLILENGMEKLVSCDSAGIVGYHEGEGAYPKMKKMTEFCTRHTYSIVPDPYYGETKDYELVIDLLEDACQGLFKSITN